jgi:hypothetical protein
MRTKLDIFFEYFWGAVFAAIIGGGLAFVYCMKTGGF